MTHVADARPRQVARVALVGGRAGVAGDAAVALTARGLTVDLAALDDAVDVATGADAGALALVLGDELSAARAATLAPMCQRAARAGCPAVLLVGPDADEPIPERERAAARAYLRAHGALLCTDPDAWLEATVLVASYGLPHGPTLAVIAPPDTWLAASARAMAEQARQAGTRAPDVAPRADDVQPSDLVLCGGETEALPERVGLAILVPVVGRAEAIAARSWPEGRPPLVGLRAALHAGRAAGRLAERIAAGFGAAPPSDVEALDVDRERFERQLDKVGHLAGDHESKVMLAAYGVPVIRQAVATTPSAATRLAKRAGFPVEVKPWGPDVPSERQGCPVERGITTAADVRRAFAGVARAADLPLGAPVIVRETPPSGREVWARIAEVGPLGWMIVVEIAGASAPLAAPAPLRRVDAAAIARHVVASREGEPEPDRDALADLLVRASHMAVEHAERIESVELSRIVVGGGGERTLVVDAVTRLHR